MKKIIKNISELVTFAPLAKENRGNNVQASDMGTLNNAWLTIEDGKISNFGPMAEMPKEKFEEVIDAGNKLVLPGLVDAHTHPIFAGSRHNEFAMRLDGRTYQEIANAGGGIKATVKYTREASVEKLSTLTNDRLNTFLKKGVTTVEVKSGYGLSPKEEIRALEILNDLNQKIDQHLVVTCLALHALPDEHKTYESFVEEINKELLPEVAKRKLASYVDAFIETGYFSVENSKPYFDLAKELGLGIRIHADEFTDAKAALAAAELGAASADHLQFASEAGIKALAKNDVTAIILPGTSLYTNIPFTQAKKYFDSGCSVALATDYNPGSCMVDNLPFIATMGALHCHLTTAQAIAAVTYVPARSLGLNHSKGSLAVGFDADLVIADAKEATEWLADMGRTDPKSVWIQGIKVI